MADTSRARLLFVVGALAVPWLGCGNSRNAPREAPAMTSGGAAAGAATSPLGGAGNGGGSIAGASASGVAGTAETPEEPWVDPYPRTWAEPTLTRALATGEVTLVGQPRTACSNQVPASGDRWCAFARGPKEGAASLWVVNVTQVAAGRAPACDEEGENCIKLTDSLWTGEYVWGPSHPLAHHFDGDTLIFHAGATEPVREPYAGPIHAWRPGWAKARQLTNDTGVTCTGHRRVAAVYCIQSLDVEKRMTGDFGPPIWHSFDLMAGLLDDAAVPLTLVERISLPLDQQSAFTAAFDRAGKNLAFSSVLSGAERESLRYVPLDELGVTTPTTVLESASQWVLSHDGKAVYALKDYDRENYVGELIVADFPSGQSVSTVAPVVSHIDPVGEDDASLSDEDRGIGYDVETEQGFAFDFLKDRTNPEMVQRLGDGVGGPRLSPTGSHTIFFQDSGAVWPLAKVVDHATNELCTLNQETTAETYNGRFTQDGRRAIWIEYGSTGSEAGFTANADCSDRVKFGDWVLGYQLQGDFVIFEGGDDMDATSYLQYARLPSASGQGAITPLHLYERPSYPIASFALAESSYIVFGGAVGSPAVPGLYLHGPLEAAATAR